MASKDKKQKNNPDSSGFAEFLQRFKERPLLFTGTVLILVIVVVAFVFVPAMGPGGQFGGDLIFGFYNRTPIQFSVGNFFHQTQQMLYQRHRPNYDDPHYFSILFHIWRQAFEETVIHMGIMDEMRRAGFITPVDVIDRRMAELPHFQENGRFSAARYRAMDSNTRANLRRQVQESLIVSTYVSDAFGLRTSNTEASFVASMGSTRRSFSIAFFSPTSYPDSEIALYIEENPELFNNIYLSKITVSGSEREARQLRDAIRNGVVSFEEAAMNHSIDWARDRGGDIGMLMAFELEFEMLDAQAQRSVMNLANGEISDVFRVPMGWVFYRANSAIIPANFADPSQNARVRSFMSGHVRGRLEDWLFSQAEIFSARVMDIGFAGAAAEQNIRTGNFGPIPLNYGNIPLFASIAAAGVPELANAGTNQFFWREAFSTPLNTPSRPVVIGDNVIVLFPLEEVPADETDIEFIESFYQHWIASSAEQALRSYFLNNPRLDDRFEATFHSLWRN